MPLGVPELLILCVFLALPALVIALTFVSLRRRAKRLGYGVHPRLSGCGSPIR